MRFATVPQRHSCGTHKSANALILLVGAAGFEPAAPCSQKRGPLNEIKGFLTLRAMFTAWNIKDLARESELTLAGGAASRRPSSRCGRHQLGEERVFAIYN